MNIVYRLMLGFVLLPVNIAAQSLLIDDFSSPSLDDWSIRSFEGSTRYQLVELDGRQVLMAQTDKSASALYREVDVDLRKTPYLNWSWRVDNIHTIADQQIKAGDDFPARLYVVVKTGFLPWQTRALNYVWSNNELKESSWPNPFTASAIMIPLRSGSEGMGQWHLERVNIREDYYRQFNQWIDRIDGIAIMSDSDNAGGSATAYYGPISFSQ